MNANTKGDRMSSRMAVSVSVCLAICLLALGYNGGNREVFSSEGDSETLTLGRLAKVYQPATFSHEMHTLLTEDCASCHHHTEGEPVSCSECHEAASARDLGIAGLKEAYHGLCMGCHKKMEMGPTGCTGCHAKKTAPAEKVAALERTKKEKPKIVPQTITVNRLQEKYGAVTFSHEIHTLVTEKCATCHHHSASGQTPSCGECHGAPFDPDNLNMPGLKGAYHLQCMGCHKEMGGGPTGCTECHTRKASKIKESKGK